MLDWFVHFKGLGRGRRVLERAPMAVHGLASFPRTIHIFWHSGFDQAPPVVKQCIQSWRKHNPSWEVRVWDERSAGDILKRSEPMPGLAPRLYSNILRNELLLRQGGVWADATLLCRRSLDCWLPTIMTQCDFFVFSRPGKDRVMASWFMAARPGSTIGRDLRAILGRLWRGRNSPPRVYFWYHYSLEYLLLTSRRFRREWNKMPRISAVPMLQLAKQLLDDAELSSDDITLAHTVPMHKLNHKEPIDLGRLNQVLGTSDSQADSVRPRQVSVTSCAVREI
jgi:NADH:ubiquinone oxidoreductase subunit